MRVKRKEPSFGEGLLEGLREAVAWKRGDVALDAFSINPVPPTRICAVRKREARFAMDEKEL